MDLLSSYRMPLLIPGDSGYVDHASMCVLGLIVSRCIGIIAVDSLVSAMQLWQALSALDQALVSQFDPDPLPPWWGVSGAMTCSSWKGEKNDN